MDNGFGKSLHRATVPGNSGNYFDLEDPRSLARLAQPMTALEGLRGVVVIDEIQRRPELFPVLRVLADRKPLPARFLILGSASPELLRQSSESLAGRIETIPVAGFSLSELLSHPKSGASWEGHAVEEVLNAIEPDQAFFWATHQGTELDLLLFKGGRRLGVEIKRMDAPALTPSMRIALTDLHLEQLIVLYPGTHAYELGPQTRVVPIGTVGSGGLDTLFPKHRPPRARRRTRAK